jgi:hypothetical protein
LNPFHENDSYQNKKKEPEKQPPFLKKLAASAGEKWLFQGKSEESEEMK